MFTYVKLSPEDVLSAEFNDKSYLTPFIFPRINCDIERSGVVLQFTCISLRIRLICVSNGELSWRN